MKTVIIQIGNSDDKLTQAQWSHYVESVRNEIEQIANEVHFFGGAPTWYPWQNVAWCIVCDESKIDLLGDRLIKVRESYKQGSVAFTIGKTVFI